MQTRRGFIGALAALCAAPFIPVFRDEDAEYRALVDDATTGIWYLDEGDALDEMVVVNLDPPIHYRATFKRAL